MCLERIYFFLMSSRERGRAAENERCIQYSIGMMDGLFVVVFTFQKKCVYCTCMIGTLLDKCFLIFF